MKNYWLLLFLHYNWSILQPLEEFNFVLKLYSGWKMHYVGYILLSTSFQSFRRSWPQAQTHNQCHITGRSCPLDMELIFSTCRFSKWTCHIWKIVQNSVLYLKYIVKFFKSDHLDWVDWAEDGDRREKEKTVFHRYTETFNTKHFCVGTKMTSRDSGWVSLSGTDLVLDLS